ncbi:MULTISPECIES: BolA family protein [unclassified Agarivorans]|uniref:BolA family protein n=1 Tax=unclassified Agarivorans TaxID=2636026 RepID=UPI0010EEDE62|nr:MULTISPECIES: BolA/IbaG family iron-sulfur metabolism protein [unclassified Agarivorans]MDO6684047.1 BolA/IbaG family iron-sulfur metabolism protein [Agarivorans sp. 3_MG-2023]MDO6714219.1 BolA/IbaG family iron-sulfur metabolism protein [Agarivorans sp. 2_MG-2023]MDO6762543.1 BolA/IbaG family iron-sulfur metabolism protein [Agarivorans sp. 1_MG-2023]GDY24922.1 transcriptional regulator [Agarivorans sp. Toyoura001]
MRVETLITDKLQQHFSPSYLEVVNESNMHNVPAGSESHFKVTIVSTEFEGKRLLQRHRAVNQLLANELQNDIHALAMHTYTPSQWAEQQNAPASPKCRGGS